MAKRYQHRQATYEENVLFLIKRQVGVKADRLRNGAAARCARRGVGTRRARPRGKCASVCAAASVDISDMRAAACKACSEQRQTTRLKQPSDIHAAQR